MKKELVLLLIILLFLAPMALADSWPNFGKNLQHRGSSTTSFSPEFDLYSANDNKAETSGISSKSTPAVNNDMIYITTTTGFQIRNFTDQTEIFSVTHSGEKGGSSTPVVSGSDVCYATKSKVRCRDATTGTQNWEFSKTNVTFEFSSAVVNSGVLWIGGESTTDAAALYAINLTDGSEVGSFNDSVGNDVGSYGTPAILYGIVYTTIQDASTNKVIAINESNASQKVWEYAFTTDGSDRLTRNQVTISNNTVFVAVGNGDSSDGSGKSRIVAINKNDGSKVWATDVDPNRGDILFKEATPAAYAGKIYAVADVGSRFRVYALNETDGTKIWESSLLKGEIPTPPAISDTKVIMAVVNTEAQSDVSSIHAFNSEDGSLIWTIGRSNEIRATPAIANNEIVVAEFGSSLLQFKTKSEITNSSIPLTSGQITTVEFPEADVTLEVNASDTATVSLTLTKELQEEGAEFRLNLTKFINIADPNNNTQDNMSATTIKIHYTDDELKELGIDEDSLVLQEFNESSSEWVDLPNSGVNKTEKFVFGDTTHFSLFGPGGTFRDGDGDGVFDKDDNCVSVSNVNQADDNNNGIGDVCDDDNDGIDDINDSCPFVANSGTDTDADAIDDACDICVNDPDPLQVDTDGDGSGDACDSDDDNDGTEDSTDLCPLIAECTCQRGGDSDNPWACDLDVNSKPIITCVTHADADNDSVGDVCDLCADTAEGAEVDETGCSGIEVEGIEIHKLNLKSNAQWLTTYLEVSDPKTNDIMTTDITTVIMESSLGLVNAESSEKYGFVTDPKEHDTNKNDIVEFMVKFPYDSVKGIIETPSTTVTIEWKLADGTKFESTQDVEVTN